MEPLEIHGAKPGLSEFDGGLAIISTIIGGGIVGLPYALQLLGTPLFVLCNILVGFVNYKSGLMYIALKEALPNHPESLYEIGFRLLGRPAIFLTSFVHFFMSVGLMLIYLIVISTTLAQTCGNFFGKSLGEVWFSSKPVFATLVGLVLLSTVIKKEIAHLDWLSKLLFGSILLFILASFALLLDPRFSREREQAVIESEPRVLLSAFCTIMVAYGYQQNIFPIYDSLKSPTNKALESTIQIGLGLTFSIYLVFAQTGRFLFKQVHPSVLQNFGEIKTPTGDFFTESFVIQCAFTSVLFCHVPFIFFVGKESVCIIVDELHRGSISKVLAADHDPNLDQAKQTYKDMNGSLYYFVTISLFIVEIALACALDDITTQFAFNAAIAATFICFWFPGGYYLLACGESANKSTAYLLMICGLINFVLGMYTAIKTMER